MRSSTLRHLPLDSEPFHELCETLCGDTELELSSSRALREYVPDVSKELLRAETFHRDNAIP